MKVIALTSSYAASVVSEADAVVQKLDQIKVTPDGARKLTISVGSTLQR